MTLMILTLGSSTNLEKKNEMHCYLPKEDKESEGA